MFHPPALGKRKKVEVAKEAYSTRFPRRKDDEESFVGHPGWLHGYCRMRGSEGALEAGVQISSISVSEDVTVSDKIYFVGKGVAFGVVGAMANSSSADLFKTFIDENKIDIKGIVRSSFLKKMEEANKFKLSSDARSIIRMNVKLYGVNNKSLLTDEYEPVLLIQAEMVDEKNEVIWKGGHYVQPLGNPVKAVSMKLIRENPGLLSQMWKAAAEFASAKTIKQL